MMYQLLNPMSPTPLTLAFDIGHSSIGWAVFESINDSRIPNLLGTGSLIFPADSCLARDRASKRRMRRNIASRRNRIKRIKSFLTTLNLITSEDTKKISPWPWHLAASVLVDPNKKLSWVEIWQVLRWYAHNRGYDGNRLWANEEVSEDTKRVEEAKKLMQELGTESMAESICRYLEVDPNSPILSPVLHKRFKGLNVAFPRGTVEFEVRKILQAQTKHHRECDDTFIRTILEDHTAHPNYDPKLPPRFSDGGLLFGQLTPRFDNRIIGTCPHTGEKLPSKHCRDFLDFRWAQLVGNIRVADEDGERQLTREERHTLTALARSHGYFTQSSLRKALEKTTNSDASHLERMIFTEEFEAGLVYDPVKKALLAPFKLRTNFPPVELLDRLWQVIPKPVRKKLFKGKSLTFSEIRTLASGFDVPTTDFDAAIQELIIKTSPKKKGKSEPLTLDVVLATPVSVPRINGRAPYSKTTLRAATSCYLNGDDPRTTGGPLYEDHHVTKKTLHTPIDKLTNNHLVRHRLKLFKRLLSDLCKQFENDDRRVESVVVEVVKDLQEFSGLSAKETKQLIGSKLAQHRRVSKSVEAGLKELGVPEAIGASLIRKARVADDLQSTCPYTGHPYSLQQIVSGDLDIEHIVPYSLRPTNSLESLVLTYRSVNEMKGNLTGLGFVRKFAGQKVPGTNLEIVTEKRYLDFVSKLRPQGPSDDDKRRCKRRKQLLTTLQYDKRKGGFTAGDLTKTSHLNKLAARVTHAFFGNRPNNVSVEHIPGSVTGAARRNWDLIGCIWKATSKVFVDEKSPQSGLKLKSEIRETTHLHHALDATSLGIIKLLLPNNGTFRELLTNRSNTSTAVAPYRGIDVISFDRQNRMRLKELPASLKSQVEDRIAENRVIFHVPAKMSGLKVEETTWRIQESDNSGKALISQRKPLKQSRAHPSGTVQRRERNFAKEKQNKLLGYETGKLSLIKGAFIVSQNFGCALDPTPQIIPFHKVKKRIDELTRQNSGVPPRVIRPGQLIEINRGKKKGIWKVASVKDNTSGLAIDMVRPHIVKAQNKDPDSGMNILIASLLRDGLTIYTTNLAGYPCPTT